MARGTRRPSPLRFAAPLRTSMRLPVRILFVAPDDDKLDSQPEIRDISSRRHIQVTLLNGPVTARDIYTHARDGFDVLHFVAHGGADGIQLSDRTQLSYQDIAQIARLAQARIIFFNSCETGKPASYVVHHGALWSIFGNIALDDASAWQHPIGFYNSLVDLEPQTVAKALRIADNASGDYGYTISLEYLLDLLQTRMQPVSYTLHTWQLGVIGFTIVVSILSAIATWFAGG